MKNNTQSAAYAMAEKQRRAMRNRHIGFIVVLIIIALTAIACVIAVLRIKEENRIQLAQNLIAQFEINTTYHAEELDPDGDADNDNVLNSAEERSNTNPRNADTDADGLDDGGEASLGTDPNNPDTDGDGLYDGFEIMSGLDPTKTSTDGSTKDSDVRVSHKTTCGELTLEVTGDANAADVSVCDMDIFGISSNTGIIGHAYDLVSDHKFDSAKITFKPDKKELERKNLKLSKLTVLKFDAGTKTYNKIESKVDGDAGTVSADIQVYGTYALGSENAVNETPVTQIAFLLDNSGSMYPVELCEVSPENDVDFKRLSFAKSLITKLSEEEEKYLFSIAKFTGNYTLMQGFTDDTKKLDKAFEEIRNDDEIFDGSHIETALSECMKTFEKSKEKLTRNIIVMLSDGASDEQNAESIESLTSRANENGIIIMTIGLGKEADRDRLRELASQTGGKYYSASDADALENIYQQIIATLNYDLVNYSDTDEPTSGYALYNTGFDPTKNGFSFKNFRTADTPSMDFGMAVFTRDWYIGKLPVSLGELSPSKDSENKYDAPGYDLSGTDIEKSYTSNKPLSSILPKMLTSDYADVKEYLDYDSKGLTLKVRSDLRSAAQEQGWVVQDFPLNSGNLTWQNVEMLSLDIKNGADKIEKASSHDELEFLKALYRLNAEQWNDEDARFDLYSSGDEGFELLKTRLASGVPMVAVIDDSHAVNVIGLVQDSEDHRQFCLQVYDNNYVGAVKNLYIKRTIKCELDENGELVGEGCCYSCDYEGKQVGLSFSDVAF